MREYSFEEMSAEQLALQAKEGNREARNMLYLHLSDMIARRIYPAKRLLGRLAMGSGPLEPEDIDQEAFLLFCELLDDWQPERLPFVDYLSRMICWRAYRYVRSSLHFRSKRVKQIRPGTWEQTEIEEKNAVLEGQFSLVEGTEQWNALLAQLRGDWQRLVSMKFYQELSSTEIARANHCSPRTVNRSLRAALNLLNHNIQEEWEAL